MLAGNFQFLHARVQGCAIHPQPLGRAAWSTDLAFCFAQHTDDVFPLDIFQRRRGRKWRHSPREQVRRVELSRPGPGTE